MKELWKTITYAQNYEISNMGNIKNIKTNKLITINYERLKKDNIRARPGLSNEGKIKGYYLHRIVAEHFLDNPEKLPEVNHIDGDFYNNKAENLEWISKIDNMRHATENKLIERYTRRVIIKNKGTNEEKIFDKVSDCAEYLKCNPGLISLTCRGKRIDKRYDMKYENEERKIEGNENIIWKEYPECKKYLISNTGEIKNKKTGRLMMGSKVNGYRFMTLFIDKDKPKMNRLLHRMVAQTFLDNPDDKPVVNHKDTNILNNNVDNLEWVTYKENMNTEETIKNLKKGKNSKIIHKILIETGEIVTTFDGASDCGIKCCLNICHFYNKGNVSCQQKLNHQKTYKKKYIFIFDEDKSKLDDFLKIARCNERTDNQKKLRKPIVQINKDTNEIIKSFDSINAAAKELNIGNSGISQCCNHYKYTDEDRPNCYKHSKQYKGYMFKYKV
tara:strand:+ start:3384 stop:4715 length:1332 start_codon:yes stop_codon:yes gene_type:complete